MVRNMKAFAIIFLGCLTYVSLAHAAKDTDFAVGPQYDTTHVYVAPDDFDHFVTSIIATFGGTTSKQGVFQVTPTPSKTMSQLALSPVGTISVFGFKTPIPFPFGAERTGYLVTDMDQAVAAARQVGANVIVTPFPDPIGRDALIQWPGGVNMQLYWHTTAPSYPPLKTIPENRVYVSEESANVFIQAFISFAKGKITADNKQAPGIEIGRPGDHYRRVNIESGFGKMVVIVTDGHLPWPYGREITGYEVTDLTATLDKAKAAGVALLVEPFTTDNRTSTIVQFPGGYIAEIHAVSADTDHAKP
jgi:predicted enzyme related to lactoylglutathione lyase